MTSNGHLREPRAWIFQANSKKYAIFDALTTQRAELWNLRQHANDVSVGDRVYIWVAGERAGIYAIGTVLSSPQIMSDSLTGICKWTDPREGRRPRASVEVRYDSVMVNRPLLKPYLQCDPVLGQLRIINFPRGTNFPLSTLEMLTIEEWLAERS